MMFFIELRNELLQNVQNLEKEDMLLLEGKLIFPKKDKADVVKEYLAEKFNGTHKVEQTVPRVWAHWKQEYESELYLRKLQ